MKKVVAIVLVAIFITFVGTAFVTTTVLTYTGFYESVRSYFGNYDSKSVSWFESDEVSENEIAKFNEVKSLLKSEYYEEIEDSTLIEGAISGMADSLEDPYTVYYNKEQMEEFTKLTDESQDTYVGIGVQVSMDENGILTVIEPFEDSPAIEVGVKSGDKIIEVDGEDVTEIRDENIIISKIKGEEDTDVEITVYRPTKNKNVDFTITRKKMTVVLNVKSEMKDDNIGYIKMSMFDGDIYNNFKKELTFLQKQGMESLIIDLRNNPGGSYAEVVDIADLILPEGLIVSTEDKNEVVSEEHSDANELEVPLAILVNGNSASASEILAGSVQDYEKGTIIGTTTFGKGLVQSVQEFSDGSGMKYTIARYFTPNGVCIQDKGIKPDIIIENDEKYENESISLIPEKDDKQLQKAIETLEKEME
jgi:carboxyl-terminal processing protease